MSIKTNISLPLTAQLELTDKCNFRCPHCYFLNVDTVRKSHDLSDEKIMLLAKKLVSSRLFSVVLTGGEPLIRKNLVIALVEYFKRNNLYVSLNTNLTLLDQKTLSAIVSLGIDGLLVSCPSSDVGLYRIMTGGSNYLRFKEKLKMLIGSGLHFSVNMVTNKLNLRSIKQTVTDLESLGVKRFGATPMALNVHNPRLDLLLDKTEVEQLIDDLVWIKECLKIEVDMFEAVPKCIFSVSIYSKNLAFLERKCQAGRTVMSVASNGDVRPCSHNPDVYGNLLNESLRSVWNKMRDWRNDVYIPDECNDCKMLYRCLGGCRVTARAFTGNPKGEDPWSCFPLKEDRSKTGRISQDIDTGPDTIVFPSKEFRWRKENDYYLVCTKTTRNSLLVNAELFKFLLTLRKIKHILLGALAKKNGIDFDDVYFQKVVKFLIKREFLLIRKI